MRALVIPAATAALLATSALAFAASQYVNGDVKAFDMKAHTLTLDNGTEYTLPTTFKDPGLKVGEKVRISWEMKDGKHMADEVTIQKS